MTPPTNSELAELVRGLSPYLSVHGYQQEFLDKLWIAAERLEQSVPREVADALRDSAELAYKDRELPHYDYRWRHLRDAIAIYDTATRTP